MRKLTCNWRKGKRQGEMEMKKMMEGRNEEQRERML